MSETDRPDLDELERDHFDVVKIRAALPFLLAPLPGVWS